MIFQLKQFSSDLSLKRIVELQLTIREAALQIGCSSATLSRIEQRRYCDMETFALCCKWMNADVNKYFNFNN